MTATQEDRTSAATRSLVIERELPHPPAKIWRALTEGPLIKEWLMENDFQPVMGRKFNFRWSNAGYSGVVDSEVMAIEPNKKLSYTWNSMGLESLVVFTLNPTKGGTLIRMEQSGFRGDQEGAYQGAKGGWTMFLGNLEKVVADLK
jgi:uncharacterized protein YndB with AHSA1/START domain